MAISQVCLFPFYLLSAVPTTFLNEKNKKKIVPRMIYLELANCASCATTEISHLALRFYKMFYVFAKVVLRTKKVIDFILIAIRTT